MQSRLNAEGGMMLNEERMEYQEIKQQMIGDSNYPRSYACLSAGSALALQEVLGLANALAPLNPSLLPFLAAQLCKLVERGPVD